MSGGSYKSYSGSSSTYRSYSDSFRSSDEAELERARKARDHRLRESRDRDEMLRRQREREEAERKRKQREKEERSRGVEDTRFDASLVRDKITRPKDGVKRIHIVAVDNSGSNRAIAAHIRSACGYFNGFLNIIDPESQIAIVYFSDHCDGDRIRQDVDFFQPGAKSEQVLFSTTHRVEGAGGGDFPEAIECVLHEMCRVDFNDATERHLYLITDAMPHGMGYPSDNGCPEQRDWAMTHAAIQDTFTSFTMVGCGDDARVLDYQERMLSPERLAYDLIDLSGINSAQHRRGITVNAFLFLVARNIGLQAVELFLSMLYEKWLDEPIFGVHTDTEARKAILRFFKYLEADTETLERMRRNVIPE